MRLFRRNPAGRAIAGAPLRFGSLIWNNQTALTQAEPAHPAMAPSRPRRVIQRFRVFLFRKQASTAASTSLTRPPAPPPAARWLCCTATNWNIRLKWCWSPAAKSLNKSSSFPAGGGFTLPIRTGMNWRSGRRGDFGVVWPGGLISAGAVPWELQKPGKRLAPCVYVEYEARIEDGPVGRGITCMK